MQTLLPNILRLLYTPSRRAQMRAARRRLGRRAECRAAARGCSRSETQRTTTQPIARQSRAASNAIAEAYRGHPAAHVLVRPYRRCGGFAARAVHRLRGKGEDCRRVLRLRHSNQSRRRDYCRDRQVKISLSGGTLDGILLLLCSQNHRTPPRR